MKEQLDLFMFLIRKDGLRYDTMDLGSYSSAHLSAFANTFPAQSYNKYTEHESSFMLLSCP